MGIDTKMPGLAEGIVKFAKKPAKMGDDLVFIIPRTYVRNGLVDKETEYNVYLQKKIEEKEGEKHE